MKKRILSVFLFTAIIFITSCGLPNDYVPESLEPWDGNYLYYSTYRMKTNQEEKNNILEDFVIDGYNYIDFEITDTFYRNENVFICLTYAENKTCVVKYNMLKKTQNLLYISKDEIMPAKSFYLIRDDLIILSKSIYSNQIDLFMIDYKGDIILNNANEYRYYTFEEDYIIYTTPTSVKYRKWDNNEFITIMSGSNISHTKLYNNRLYIYFVEKKKDHDVLYNHEAISLYIYDFQSQVLEPIFIASDYKSIYILNENYFISYESVVQLIDSPNVSPRNKYYIYFRKNCILYKINSDMSITKLYVFDKNKDYTSAKIYENILKISVELIVRKEINYENVLFDIDTLKFTKSSDAKEKVNKEKYVEARLFNNYYYYYSESINYFYLHKKNIETGANAIVQYYLKNTEEEVFGIDYFSYSFIHAIRNY